MGKTGKIGEKLKPQSVTGMIACHRWGGLLSVNMVIVSLVPSLKELESVIANWKLHINMNLAILGWSL
jgi:hypothetical protein